ncbi:hypothetical protein ACHWQZ_G015093 [Mnemiopsis leidyi]
MSAINVVPDKPNRRNQQEDVSPVSLKGTATHPHPHIVVDSDSDDGSFPDHYHIYERRPEYDYLMEKYWKEKEKERQRNKELEKGHGLHWQHKHIKPSDIFSYKKYKESGKDKKPELKMKENSSYFLEEGDNYIMNDFNNRRARKHENEVAEKNRLKQLIRSDIAEREALHKIMELKTRDKDWDHKYHAERGDMYLQHKHRDFDKHWKHHDDQWNKTFKNVGDWSTKRKSHHHKNGAILNKYNFGQDPSFVPPQLAYPHHDRYWSRSWFEHYHSFERSKKMTLAIHHRFHNEKVSLQDYYHPEIRNMGPEWWLKHLKRQLDTDPRPVNAIGNVAQLIINNFPISVFTARYENNHKNILDIIEKHRKKANVSQDAVISVELDNSRAGLKIFSDLRYYSPMTMLPQVWFNGELLGTFETLKKLKKSNRLISLLREAEFEGKMPCELCQDVLQGWYSKWHRQHYPYFDRNVPYEGWG